MGVLAFLILGIVAGAIAKAVHTGHEPGGFLGTMFVGVVGALLGGVIASAAGLGGLESFFSLGTWLVAMGGALLLLLGYNAVAGSGSGRRHTTR